MKSTKRPSSFLAPLTLFLLPSIAAIAVDIQLASADIGAVIYDSISTRPPGTFGHAAAYLSNVCQDQTNHFRLCEPNEDGVVINRYAGISAGNKLDWLSVPANINFYGAEDPIDAPLISDKQVIRLISDRYYKQSDLSTLLKYNRDVELNLKNNQVAEEDDVPYSGDIPSGRWRMTVGKVQYHSFTIISVKVLDENGAEDLEFDRRIIDHLNSDPNHQRFSVPFETCANFVNDLLRVGLGKDYSGHGGIEDFTLVSPDAVGVGIMNWAKRHKLRYSVTRIPQIPTTRPPGSLPVEISALATDPTVIGSPLGIMFPLVMRPLAILNGVRRLIPGFHIGWFVKEHLDFSREVKQEGSPELSGLSYELREAKHAHADKSDVELLRGKIKQTFDAAFGTKACWAAQRQDFDRFVAQAIAQGKLRGDAGEYAKPPAVEQDFGSLVPYHLLAPENQSRRLVADTLKDVEFHDDPGEGLTFEREGKRGGLTRRNLLNFDPGLGLEVMAIVIDHELSVASLNRPNAAAYDADRELLLQVAERAGVNVANGIGSLVQCSTSPRSDWN